MTATSKPFQAATARAATAALSGANPRRRFLVADEVGLGKTVVARDTLAALSQASPRFTVYYITSGLKIADQNKLELLRFLHKETARDALSDIDRIGLIPFAAQHHTGLRLYAFTPTTSFSASGRLYGGKAVERAFIKLLLDDIAPGLGGALPDGYMEHGATAGWPWACQVAQGRLKDVDRTFIAAYAQALGTEFGTPLGERIPAAVRTGKAGAIIGRMRKALAQAALASAPPDLVIFDEFQCYRDLFDPCTGNYLMQQLLQGAQGRSPPALLLLSATPYRLYAERWETGSGKTPHDEFFEIIDFLGGAETCARAKTQFAEFGALLDMIGRLSPAERQAAIDKAQVLKRSLEDILAPLMSRTERPALRQTTVTDTSPLRMEPHDIDVFRHFASQVSPKLAGSAIVYWLSVPLPAQALGERYQISRDVTFQAKAGLSRLTPSQWTKPPKDAWGSAKLRALNALVPTEALALPWVLPSLPWWTPAGPWSKMTQSPKMLIFSRFRATPQSLAALVSLEVERKYLGAENPAYAAAWKTRHLTPKPNQGTIFALFHPSPFLIKAVDPLDVTRKSTITHVKTRARQQIIQALPPTIKAQAPDARGKLRRKPVWALLAAIERAAGFDAGKSGWAQIARQDVVLQSLLEQRRDADEISWLNAAELDALVDMALGAPGIVAGRALYRHLQTLFDDKTQFTNLLVLCWTRLRSYLDRPVFWSILPGKNATEKYQRATVEGCLEAVLDEHFWLRKSKVGPAGLIDDLSAALSANIGTFGFKHVAERNRKSTQKRDKIRIRCHAAVAFGGSETEPHHQGGNADQSAPARSEEIRSAFNTPFWPHILATTSVGQEGLDFHSWCHRLGHWDLCSSPVDLEQREGRVQRFAGLTVRRPLAHALGADALSQAKDQHLSPWEVIAQKAERAFTADPTGLTPWWTIDGADLQRHMFVLPQSRDIARLAKLKSQRTLYRLALGQPDQEGLLELLSHHNSETIHVLQALTLDLSAISRERRLQADGG